MRRNRLIAAFLCAIVGLLVGTGCGDKGEERITSFSVAVRVERDGTLQVVETIDYDFAGEDRHGIYRYVPERIRVDDDHDRIYDIELRSVQRDGSDEPVEQDTDNGNKVFKIGDEDEEISGKHRYEIAYTVGGAMDDVDGEPMLSWNAIGTGWDVPIDDIHVGVEAPGAIRDAYCAVGSAGSEDPCIPLPHRNNVSLQVPGLKGHEGVTIRLGMPQGSVEVAPPHIGERVDAAYRLASDPWTWIVALVIGCGGIVGVGVLVWARGRDRRYANQIPGLAPASGQAGAEDFRPILASPEGPVEFVPPRGVRPGHLGPLIRQSTQVRDVTASIVDFAVRGHLRIEETGAKDWTLHQLRRPDPSWRTYERQLFDGLFDGAESRQLSSLDKTFASTTNKVRSELMNDAIKLGWYERSPSATRAIWFGIGFGVFVFSLLPILLLSFLADAGVIGFAVTAIGLALIIGAWWMPARTAAGSAAYAQALGFRRYIRVAEAEQLRFEEREAVFSRYLPYAIAFGEADRWVARFAAVGAVSDPGWYSSAAGFNTVSFASSMDSFVSTSSATMTSTSGSSGGGVGVGGGGGGGGGGSW